MAMKMDRRTFMKSAAVAALAVSMSGMLTGCEDSDAGAVKTTLGEFEVSVTPKMTIEGKEVIGENGRDYLFMPVVKLKYIGSGYTAVAYKNVFSATISDETLKLQNGNSMIAKGDLPFGKTQTYIPQFEASTAAYNTFKKGTGLKLTVTLQGQSAVFTLNNAGKVTVKH